MGKKVLGKGLSALISSKPSGGDLNKEMSSLDISAGGGSACGGNFPYQRFFNCVFY